MEMRTLGKTGLQVTRLGVGLAELSRLEIAQEDVERTARVLNMALDAGINFLDTAACYGNSEELIGRTVADRRDEFVLATKAGHITGGYEGEAWTAKTITDSIERSLRRLRTDYLDIVQLHTCGVDVLERGEVIEALQQAQQAGKTRFIGYSGDNEAAAWAVNSGIFDTLQTTFNLVDQRARKHLFGPAQEQNMGIIIKRPIGNAVWGAAECPSDYAKEYFKRACEMQELGELPNAPDNGILLALGFAFAHEAADTFIVGTSNPDHMRSNIRMVEEELPIAEETVKALYRLFDEASDNWEQRS